MQVTVNLLLSGTVLVIGHDNRTDEVDVQKTIILKLKTCV